VRVTGHDAQCYDVMMQDGSTNESLVVFQNSQGLPLRGTLLRLARYEVVFEFYEAAVLRLSEVLDQFKIYLRNEVIYSGKAVITNLVNAGSTTVCEARLDDVWINQAERASSLTADRMNKEFDHFLREWEKQVRITGEYKLFVSELQSFFHDLRLWLEQVELEVRSMPSGSRHGFEHDLAEGIGRKALEIFQTFVWRFETLAAALEPETVPAHRAYMRSQMHPLLFCSPWVYRTVAKPLGYAGDYEMVNMMLRDPLEGASLFAKVVNFCFINQGPVIAHRNRIDCLVEKLVEEALRTQRGGRQLRVLSIGCGPAIEVQRFLDQGRLADNARFDLLDFNEETLQHTGQALAEATRRNGRSTAGVTLIRKSVQQIVKEAARSSQEPVTGGYDLVYCAGLFDYLTDQICRRLMERMFNLLAPGGLLLATNVAPCNPLRYGMEHMLDWNLVYRTPQQMLALHPARPADQARIKSDLTGVNIWLEIRKAGDG
jgi:extracellular factor (EF) 3-hydroxypalmitic acid methyl ester biosynthesis protein